MATKIGWLFTVLFILALTFATVMNVTLINQARRSLEALGPKAPEIPGTSWEYHVALVIPDTSDSFFDGLTEGVLSSSPLDGVAVQVFRYRNSAPEEADVDFQLCLAARLDGVILYCAPDGKMSARRADARAAGVVFVPTGTQAPRETNQGFIGASSLLQGVEAGNIVTRKLGNSARIGLILSHDTEVEPTDDPMYRGLTTALRSFSGSRVVQVYQAHQGILSGEEAALLLLKENPSINVLVCASAPLTEGTAQVVVEHSLVGRVAIVGTDETPVIDRLVDKGIVAASVVRDSRKMGVEALNAFIQERQGKLFNRPVEVGFRVRERLEPNQ